MSFIVTSRKQVVDAILDGLLLELEMNAQSRISYEWQHVVRLWASSHVGELLLLSEDERLHIGDLVAVRIQEKGVGVTRQS